MTHITPAAEDQLEKSMETWKVKTLAIGGVIGAMVGLAGAFMLVQNAEKRNVQNVSISTGEGFRLGVLVFGLLRQISTLHEE
jgi:ABC-type uncharacterized transport system permease subunit